MNAEGGGDPRTARESIVAIGSARLFVREIGSGLPIVVLHGGPDFDHGYLLPELDRLAAQARLFYYDQRGRGRSADGVVPDDVSIESEVADLEALRGSMGLEAGAVLGHSWGGLLAMEYATRHPERVNRMILLGTAPAAHADWVSLREHLRELRAPEDLARMRDIAASEAFLSGDVETELEYNRIHFRPTVRDAAVLDRIVARLHVHRDPARVLLARAIEHRLYDQTGNVPGYDLIPRLSNLDIPTLLVHGEHDFIPVDVARHVAEAMRRATLTVLPGVGHFAFVERPDLVEEAIAEFIGR